MSGICGMIRFDGQEVKKEEIQNMLDVMKNRGNDAEGLWADGSVGSGHKMLWTTPESLLETQPLIDKKSNLVLTADARIDNRDELIEKLEINEKKFDVITDIDLILWSYQKWGEDCPKYLIGDFAFAIWDTGLQKLFCARDPMGIKQFYYYQCDDYLIFASEIVSIFTNKNIVKSPNIPAIKNFLSKMTLLYQDTFYKDIYRLSPAHILTVSNGENLIHRYWFPENIKIDHSLSMEDAVKKFNELFDRAVSTRLRSAYPVGAHISGGLDSSSVAATACALGGKDAITAFSLHYGELQCDESKYSNALIDDLGIRAEIIRADQLDYEKAYSVDHHYERESDWSGSGLFLEETATMEKAQKLGIRVMLTGQGGDHLLTGSEFMLADYLKGFRFIKLYKELRYYGFSKEIIKKYAILPLLSENAEKIIRILFRKQKKLSQSDDMVGQTSYFLDSEGKNYKPNSLAQYDDLSAIAGMGTAFWLSFRHLNGRYDIEYRHPFFDRRLIEFTLMLPPDMKMKEGVIKVLLRNAMGNRLPEIIRTRSDKAEFSEMGKIQFDALKIKNHDIFKIFEYDIKESEEIKNESESFRSGTSRHSMFFWNTILIEKWLQYNFK